MQFFHETFIDFLGARKYAAIFSIALIVIGLVSMLLHKGIEYGIDFTGGTSLQLAFEKPIAAGDLRSSLQKINMANAEIKKIGMKSANEYLIRTEQLEEGSDSALMIENQISADYPDNAYEILSANEIGPKIGGELRRSAILAILISLLGILIYVSWRFEFKFAVGAVIALFHDVLITLGIFSLLGLEITLTVIAAFLTIVGYSLNDTIVIYDRIRENLKIMRRDSLYTIINTSINQTISRTIITSLTTLLVVVVLYFFGGEVIRDFSFAMIIGIVIGTYSSIFIASAIVYEWHRRQESEKTKKVAVRTAH
ncbi:MAG TPA: protein translocase subunit SecF [bacterium]|jgi:preprotein translocase SecF subunit|nr:protein translocase subunit SecF [bacterium]HNT64251.1 protein translocase subunit SecF [bacterium]